MRAKSGKRCGCSPDSRQATHVTAAIEDIGEIAALDSDIALSAAHYGVVHKLPLGCSIIFATAKQFNATMWPFDADFKPLPGVKYFYKS